MEDKAAPPKKRSYCAIYTRKSTSEGLDQDFTSLDAQREAGENYIQSQKSEGWIVLPEIYDDGGYTGANTDRPALQKLLSDIKDGKIDCVVVYKVDRLSRSLLDFTKLLEFFDKNNVSFVSVTQHFNTNTSMGRLTLHILLSFAQFEREIISERTKDKMAAARKKGRWAGGRPILGYDLDRDNKKLVINEKEAKLVREIFELYLKEKSLLSTAMRLNERGLKSKKSRSKSGKEFGGASFKSTHVQYIVKNPLYLGKVEYNGVRYPGLHDAIIGEETFNKVQALLGTNRVKRETTKNTKNVGLLNNLLRCKACDSIMYHTYTLKGSYKYRYYVCTSAQKKGYQSCPTQSVNADAMENAVIESLKKIAKDSTTKRQAISHIQKSLQEKIKSLVAEQAALDEEIQSLAPKIDELKVSLKNGQNNLPEAAIKKLKETLQDKERLLSEVRIKKVEAEEKLLGEKELDEALVVTSPIWDTLFPQEKRRILLHLLKSADYDARTKKLGLILSEKGIKLLCSEIKGSL